MELSCWYGSCLSCYRIEQGNKMNMDSILNGQLDINTVLDNTGRKYFNLKVSFSDQDALTIYRNSIDELLEDLPQIIVSAVRARIVNETDIQQ